MGNDQSSHALVVAPHAFCPEKPPDASWHMCDFAAGIAAKELQHELREKKIQTDLILSDIPRDLADLNRRHARFTKHSRFRAKIREVIGKHHPLWLFDIHSFWPQASEFKNAEIAIVSDREEKWAKRLLSWLGKKKINAVGLAASKGTLDITQEATSLGCQVSFLLELNESLSRARRQEILQQVALFMAVVGDQ